MILTIDIGNTVIGIALCRDEEIFAVVNIETNKNKLYDEYAHDVLTLLKPHLQNESIKHAIIASVVPNLTSMFVELVTKLYQVTPLVVGVGVKTGLHLKVDNPSEVGADIVACAVGASSKYEGPVIVIDLGTANKYFYVDENKTFHGVAISVGLVTGFKALVLNASQLLNAPLEAPRKVLGTNTRDSLSSGAIYGLISEIYGFVKLIQEETKIKSRVVLTGGNANPVVKLLDQNITNHEPNLVHIGLLSILRRNIYAKK